MSKLALVICGLCFILSQTSACYQKQGEINEFFNVSKNVELVFFFKKDSSYEERRYFYENTLMKKTETGYTTRDGVDTVFGIDKNGYKGNGIKFSPTVTKEQTDDIKSRLKESPLIYKIFENVVPNEIKDL
jgi:hypothetical protein